MQKEESCRTPTTSPDIAGLRNHVSRQEVVTQNQSSAHRVSRILGVVVLLGVMAAEVAISAHRMSQTFDEACHIFAGYRYWKDFDFGINPEHPPLVKLVAGIPLLSMHLRTAPLPQGSFKAVEFIGARQFLYGNDADAVLLRARPAAALAALALALAIFLAARAMWGTGPAFLALILVAFEPNLLAHSSLVTTDVGVAFGIFLGVYCFYRFATHSTLLTVWRSHQSLRSSTARCS